jgi:hypothetical protein
LLQFAQTRIEIDIQVALPALQVLGLVEQCFILAAQPGDVLLQRLDGCGQFDQRAPVLDRGLYSLQPVVDRFLRGIDLHPQVRYLPARLVVIEQRRADQRRGARQQSEQRQRCPPRRHGGLRRPL